MNDSLADLPLSLKQKVLLATDGTVTDLVALFAGESIGVTKLSQEISPGSEPLMLRLAEPTPLLKRAILLSGSNQHYLYAQSHFVIDRMPPNLQKQLLETDTPIGLLWKQARLEMYREVIERKLERNADLLRHFPNLPDERFLSRTYLVYHQQRPLGAITEKFPYSYFADPPTSH